MRIDVHAHYWTDDYLDLLVDLGKTDTAVSRNLGAGGAAELDARLRLMDQAAVEMQVLSASPQLPYGENREKAVKVARFVNEQYATLVDCHRDRFREHRIAATRRRFTPSGNQSRSRRRLTLRPRLSRLSPVGCPSVRGLLPEIT